MDTTNEKLQTTTNSYLEQAKNLYLQLAEQYNDQGGLYWPLGCTLSSMIDFLNIAVQEKLVSLYDAQSFLIKAAENYQPNGDWYDDWGWWGNATAKVFDANYKVLFHEGHLQHKFKIICRECFDYMKTGDVSKNNLITGAPQAYNTALRNENIYPNQGWEVIVKNAEPVWNTGCWQYYMSPSDYNPFTRKLGPFQDTVVNGLYYIFTQRVLAAGYSSQSDIDMMTQYFDNWMGKSVPVLTADQQLFNLLKSSPKAGLFRERVSIYKNLSSVNGFNKDLAWTGDQGLMLSALTILYKNNNNSETLELIKAIIRGVFEFSVDSNTNLILPWSTQNYSPQPGPAPGDDPGDYSSGTGIFMRGLLQASSIPAVLDLIGEPSIQKVFKTTADSCLRGQYPFGGDTVFKQFNELATLTAASKLLLKSI